MVADISTKSLICISSHNLLAGVRMDSMGKVRSSTGEVRFGVNITVSSSQICLVGGGKSWSSPCAIFRCRARELRLRSEADKQKFAVFTSRYWPLENLEHAWLHLPRWMEKNEWNIDSPLYMHTSGHPEVLHLWTTSRHLHASYPYWELWVSDLCKNTGLVLNPYSWTGSGEMIWLQLSGCCKSLCTKLLQIL